MIKVHILIDDRVRKRGLIAEHGLSLWIEKDDALILFDTGQSSAFYHNAKALSIDITRTDYIIISHGHYDHCGGLRYFPCNHNNEKFSSIYVHPNAFLKKYASTSKDEPSREVGIPFDIVSYEWLQKRIIYTRRPLNIEQNIQISGEIPCLSTFEEVPKDFYTQKGGSMVHDMMLDEQMLIIEDEGEIALFLGCSHPGVVNCIKYAQRLNPDKPIKLLMGGMHLGNATPISLQMTMQHIQDMGIGTVVPLHCTGFEQTWELKRFLGNRCLIVCTGDAVEV